MKKERSSKIKEENKTAVPRVWVYPYTSSLDEAWVPGAVISFINRAILTPDCQESGVPQSLFHTQIKSKRKEK